MKALFTTLLLGFVAVCMSGCANMPTPKVSGSVEAGFTLVPLGAWVKIPYEIDTGARKDSAGDEEEEGGGDSD